MFKKGDLVIIEQSIYFTGIVCKYEGIKNNGNAKLTIQHDWKTSAGLFYEKGKEVTFGPRSFKKLPLNNSLNRKIYPNRKEWKGLLLPEKIAAKLKEQK